jgi:hypothetical protein
MFFMIDNLMDILIFKTNIRTESDKLHVKQMLETLHGIEEWSVDCEDIDCVLRVVSRELTIEDIIKIINKAGFDCLELE